MPRTFLLLALMLSLATWGCQVESSVTTRSAEQIRDLDDDELRALANDLTHRYILVDGHIDVPYRLRHHWEDVSQRTDGGDFDAVRAEAGGLNAPFMSIYIPSRYQETGGALALADSLIDSVEAIVASAPDQVAIATSPEDIRAHFKEGLLSLPMGLENGAAIEDDLANLNHLYDRGIRYVTLTHATNNQIGDSSYDSTRTWNGLSPFGREVVHEMNRLGILVDISHVSDSTAYDVLAVSRAPVIASHSSARHFTPGWERNMSDALIRALADNNGIIMINFGSSFLRSGYQDEGNRIQEQITDSLARQGLDQDSEAGRAFYNAQRRAHPVGSVQDVVAHIEHVRQLVGINHIGLGSDFDGVFALPEGLQDVSAYPNLVYELLKTGNYSEDDIAKLLGGNLLRVWDDVERVSQEW